MMMEKIVKMVCIVIGALAGDAVTVHLLTRAGVSLLYLPAILIGMAWGGIALYFLIRLDVLPLVE
jgi:hypothetical protein